jgi:TnsA endonuclease N terminal.
MYTPVPMKRSTKYGNNYWEVYSRKVERNVRLFSDLEYDNWLLLEANANVITFCEQPLSISYKIDGKLVHSIFDMWVKYSDNKEVFMEVKYLNQLSGISSSLRALRQTAVQRRWCEEHNYLYIIQTESEIRKNRILLANCKTIISYTKNRTTSVETDCLKIMKMIKNDKVLLIDLENSLVTIGKSRIRESICWLIYKGEINANIDEFLLGSETEVWINNEKADRSSQN